MNKFFLALLVSISLPAIAADDDYAKVRKDVSVMAKIIKGAFEESKDCKKCNPRIETTYLAKQGAVFRVKPSSWTSFTSSFTGDGDYSFVVPPVEPVEGVRAIQIREFVGDVLDDVGVVLSDVGDQLDMEFGEWAVFDQRDPGFPGLRIDDDFVTHRSACLTVAREGPFE